MILGVFVIGCRILSGDVAKEPFDSACCRDDLISQECFQSLEAELSDMTGLNDHTVANPLTIAP